MTDYRDRRLRIAFVEPYFGGSHRAFAEGYAAASRHDVVLFTHPASFWKWRMQGGFYTLARQVVSSAERDGQFDLVVATSMLDLARFAGVARKALGGAPLVLYMHENQLTYPVAPRDDFDMTYALINWSAMAAADLVLFNSAFHLREWFEALPRLLRRLPDERHNGLIPDVAKRCEVQPAGVDLGRFDVSDAIRGECPLILWNQRWDHDKDPDLFAIAMSEAAQSGLEFDLALAGEQFVSNPPAFEELRVTFGERIVHYGQADHSSYVDLLRRADVVVSTARQEFFGIAITEAVYAGAFPLLPNALVYPERIPEKHHSICLYDDRADLLTKLTSALTHREQARSVAESLHPVMAQFDWNVVGSQLDKRFEALRVEGR